MAGLLNKGWGDVKASFSDSNQAMGNAIQSLSSAGNIFDKVATNFRAMEQMRLEDIAKHRQLDIAQAEEDRLAEEFAYGKMSDSDKAKALQIFSDPANMNADGSLNERGMTLSKSIRTGAAMEALYKEGDTRSDNFRDQSQHEDNLAIDRAQLAVSRMNANTSANRLKYEKEQNALEAEQNRTGNRISLGQFLRPETINPVTTASMSPDAQIAATNEAEVQAQVNREFNNSILNLPQKSVENILKTRAEAVQQQQESTTKLQLLSDAGIPNEQAGPYMGMSVAQIQDLGKERAKLKETNSKEYAAAYVPATPNTRKGITMSQDTARLVQTAHDKAVAFANTNLNNEKDVRKFLKEFNRRISSQILDDDGNFDSDYISRLNALDNTAPSTFHNNPIFGAIMATMDSKAQSNTFKETFAVADKNILKRDLNKAKKILGDAKKAVKRAESPPDTGEAWLTYDPNKILELKQKEVMYTQEVDRLQKLLDINK